jgi:hypothetical protein
MANTVQSGRVLSAAARPTTLRPASTFVFGKSREVSESETCEFFDIAVARRRSLVQMALKQATPAVRGIDAIMSRPVDGPCGIYRLS